MVKPSIGRCRKGGNSWQEMEKGEIIEKKIRMETFLLLTCMKLKQFYEEECWKHTSTMHALFSPVPHYGTTLRLHPMK
jgi:hypothetical protein